jgi:DNA-binding CsgD family transcriptional regulator
MPLADRLGRPRILALRPVGLRGRSFYARTVIEQRETDEPRLSRREAAVLGLASIGLTNAEIAERLGLSVHAVKFHLGGVYRKLGVSNRTMAARFYLSGGSGIPGPPA